MALALPCRLQLLIDPDQHGGGLGPGGGLVRGKGGGGHALGHADGIGHGDVALAGCHICKGKGLSIQKFCRPAEAQAPDQHLRHLRPGDGVIGPEGLVRVHHARPGGGADGGKIGVRDPGGELHGVRDALGGAAGGAAAPVHHPAEDGDELGPGHRIGIAEGGGAVSAHKAAGVGLGHLSGQSAAGGHIPESRSSSGDRQQRQCQHGAEGQCQETMLHRGHLSFVWDRQGLPCPGFHLTTFPDELNDNSVTNRVSFPASGRPGCGGSEAPRSRSLQGAGSRRRSCGRR